MEIQEKKIDFKYFNNYRVIHHLGSELIEIKVQRLVGKWYWVKKWKWITVYIGHVHPIQFSLDFYNKSMSEEKSKKAYCR